MVAMYVHMYVHACIVIILLGENFLSYLLCNYHLCENITCNVNLLCTYICMYAHIWMTVTIVFNIINPLTATTAIRRFCLITYSGVNRTIG